MIQIDMVATVTCDDADDLAFAQEVLELGGYEIVSVDGNTLIASQRQEYERD